MVKALIVRRRRRCLGILVGNISCRSRKGKRVLLKSERVSSVIRVDVSGDTDQLSFSQEMINELLLLFNEYAE